MLKTKPFDEFELLILMKRQNICHFVKTSFSVNKPETIGSIQRSRLHLLLHQIDSSTGYLYRVFRQGVNTYLHLCECKDPHLKLGRIL
jgi:hypothetical protein